MMANPILDKISKLNAKIEQLRAENSHLRRIGMNRKTMNKYIFNVGDNSWSTQIILYATSIDGACDQFTEKFATAMGMANLTADNILSVEEYDFG